MKGLLDALAANEPGLIQNRMQLIDMGRSDVRAIVLDADGEEFERAERSWLGIDKPFEILMRRLSAGGRVLRYDGPSWRKLPLGGGVSGSTSSWWVWSS